ncbi:MAG: hypothetical protein ABI480_19090, partial [Chitinophagaceae bacterium]
MVRNSLMILFMLQVCLYSYSQEVPPIAEQQLENLTSEEQTETEDDSYLQSLVRFKKDPVNLNTVGKDELEELNMLSDLQIDCFIQYRRLFGRLVDKYELQAIPAWDIITIKKLLPYITIGTSVSLVEDLRTRFNKGAHSLLLRVSQVLEKSATTYNGSPQHLFLRYAYSYKKLLQFGLTAEKDAGESFFRGAQKSGFDFYSFHFFLGKKGIIQSLIVGDFTVNMGQGLIQWQSMAFKKSAEIMSVKRQSPVIRPYNSAAEFNFHRGLAISLRKRKWEVAGFISLRKLDASLNNDSTGDYFSSFQLSGYHRTSGEMEDKNAIQQFATGGSILYTGNKWRIGINTALYNFSANWQKRDEPYNLYSIHSNHWWNTSLDYSYTYKNVHLFGETAVDLNKNIAVINGLLISAGRSIDLSILYRHLAAAYQAVNGNAFTENTSPSNEHGIYAGFLLRLPAGWQFAVYADVYQFPWLKYLVDAPANGRDFLCQLIYTPTKQIELYTRYKNESKQSNQSFGEPMNGLTFFPKQNWRTQLNYAITSSITLRNRIELVWYDRKQSDGQTGFLLYMDALYKPLLRAYSAIMRVEYFETSGYDARLYAYENDVLYSYA